MEPKKGGQMNIRPMDDRILVKPDEKKEKIGSLYIPETAKEKPLIGEVIAIGTLWLTPTLATALCWILLLGTLLIRPQGLFRR